MMIMLFKGNEYHDPHGEFTSQWHLLVGHSWRVSSSAAQQFSLEKKALAVNMLKSSMKKHGTTFVYHYEYIYIYIIFRCSKN